MSLYELRGGDDAAYGPSFGPLRAKLLFETVMVETGTPCLVLKCDAPLRVEGRSYEHVALTMRYSGEQLGELHSREAVVAVYGLNCEKPDSLRDGAHSRELDSIAVGSCRPFPVGVVDSTD